MISVDWNVPSISCGRCERDILAVFAGLNGVTDVRVDIPRRRVSLRYDERAVREPVLLKALAAANFPVDGLPPTLPRSSCCCASR